MGRAVKVVAEHTRKAREPASRRLEDLTTAQSPGGTVRSSLC